MGSPQSHHRGGTSRRTGRLAAAVLVCTVAVAATVPAGASAPVGEARAASSRSAPRATSLTLLVHGCDGCTIQPVRAGITATSPVWRAKKKKVRNGSGHLGGVVPRTRRGGLG